MTAVERDPKRAARLRENLARLQLPAEVVVTDAVQWDAGGALFDAVLLDAPCSATGTIRRHPDVPYLKRAEGHRRHGRAAAHAAGRGREAAGAGRPAGASPPARCRPRRARRIWPPPPRSAWLVDPVRPEEVPGLAEAITPRGTLRTRPDFWAEHGGMDGFFVARFVKRG